MNVHPRPVKTAAHVLTDQMGTHVNVCMDTLVAIVKQVHCYCFIHPNKYPFYNASIRKEIKVKFMQTYHNKPASLCKIVVEMELLSKAMPI